MTTETSRAPRSRSALRYVGWGVLAFVGVVLGAILVVGVAAAIIPRPVLESSPDPAADYEAATARIEELESLDTDEIGWGTRSYVQGSRVETAVVLFHGYTNNPAQFERIGQAYADAGYNVLIPRMPGHGYADLMSEELSRLDAETLAAFTDNAIDIAAGLGSRVEVVGLSGGGTTAAWAAYTRDEVQRAVLISPLFEPLSLPNWLVRPITQLTRVLPDYYLWWDPRLKGERNIPPDAYPRYSLRSISAFLELGYSVEDDGPQRDEEIEEILFVSNASDRSVNESFAYSVVIDRLGPIAEKLDFYEYPQQLGLAHDLIDPDGNNADSIDEIYAELYRLVGLPVDEAQ